VKEELEKLKQQMEEAKRKGDCRKCPRSSTARSRDWKPS